jgi:hypothetical protein
MYYELFGNSKYPYWKVCQLPDFGFAKSGLVLVGIAYVDQAFRGLSQMLYGIVHVWQSRH